MSYIRKKKSIFSFICHVQPFFNDIMNNKLQVVKIGLITLGQREETPKLVRLRSVYSFILSGNVVWKSPYYNPLLKNYN